MSRPLQTRSCTLQPSWLKETDLAQLFTLLSERGFNAVVLPVLAEGSTHFWASRSGELKGADCEGREAITLASKMGLTVLLGVDFLSAGPVGSNQFGTLAARHGNWLMRTSRGRHQVPQFPELPGLFCWSSIEFRRYVANLVVTIASSHPIDGICIDLRHMPRTTNDPRSWTHLGYACLERIQHELTIDIEDFLNQPSRETLRRIDDWRLAQFLKFIEVLKSRIQVLRQDPLVSAIVAVDESDDPWSPWLPAVRRGVVNELILAGPPSPARRRQLFEAILPEPIPLLIGLESEAELAEPETPSSIEGTLGYHLLAPTLEAPPQPNPPESVLWDATCSLELAPIQACSRMISHLAAEFQAVPKHGEFFARLDEYFRCTAGTMKYDDAQKVRRDMIKIARGLRESPPGSIDESHRRDILAGLATCARLLALCPIGSLEY